MSLVRSREHGEFSAELGGCVGIIGKLRKAIPLVGYVASSAESACE